MDQAVAVVETYLRVDGYLIVAEYPVLTNAAPRASPNGDPPRHPGDPARNRSRPY